METGGVDILVTETPLSKGKGRNPKWRYLHLHELIGWIEGMPELKYLKRQAQRLNANQKQNLTNTNVIK